MKMNRWFMAGLCILAANAVAVVWTTIQHHAYADFNQNASQLSDANSLNPQASENKQIAGTSDGDADSSVSGDVKLDVTPPVSKQDIWASELPLPDVPSLSGQRSTTADALRNDPVLDELKEMFGHSSTPIAELPDSAIPGDSGGIDTLPGHSANDLSTASIESSDRRWEAIEYLAKSARALNREANLLLQQGKFKQARAMLSIALQIRGTMLRLMAESPK